MRTHRGSTTRLRNGALVLFLHRPGVAGASVSEMFRLIAVAALGDALGAHSKVNTDARAA
jgi:hypothetical protein